MNSAKTIFSLEKNKNRTKLWDSNSIEDGRRLIGLKAI